MFQHTWNASEVTPGQKAIQNQIQAVCRGKFWHGGNLDFRFRKVAHMGNFQTIILIFIDLLITQGNLPFLDYKMSNSTLHTTQGQILALRELGLPFLKSGQHGKFSGHYLHQRLNRYSTMEGSYSDIGTNVQQTIHILRSQRGEGEGMNQNVRG